MERFGKLYDEYENARVRFVGFMTEETRCDFGIVFTDMFFGKLLVICMQTGRSALLDQDDLKDLDHLQSIFKIKKREEAQAFADFFDAEFPAVPFHLEYE
ncbi:MAG: SAV0927 family protein [Bacillus sp. (in: firmicutes)]